MKEPVPAGVVLPSLRYKLPHRPDEGADRCVPAEAARIAPDMPLVDEPLVKINR